MLSVSVSVGEILKYWIWNTKCWRSHCIYIISMSVMSVFIVKPKTFYFAKMRCARRRGGAKYLNMCPMPLLQHTDQILSTHLAWQSSLELSHVAFRRWTWLQAMFSAHVACSAWSPLRVMRRSQFCGDASPVMSTIVSEGNL